MQACFRMFLETLPVVVAAFMSLFGVTGQRDSWTDHPVRQVLHPRTGRAH